MKKKTVGFWKKRLLTLGLALTMVFSQGSFAMAAPAQESEAQEAVSGEETGVTEEELGEEAVGILSEAAEESEEAAGEAEDTVEIPDEVAPAEPSEEIEEEEPLAAEPEVQKGSPEEFLMQNGSMQAVSPLAAQEVQDGSYQAVRYPTRVVVKNNVSSTEIKDDLYGVLVLRDAFAEAGSKMEIADYHFLMWGTRIKPGSSSSLYTVVLPDGTSRALSATEEYTLLLGRAFEWTDENGKENIEEFGFLGYEPKTTTKEDGETTIVKDDEENIVYQEYNILARETDSISVEKLVKEESKEDALKDEDGHEILAANGEDGFRMTAALQKNMTIKFSWTPTKDQNNTYKKFLLRELKSDGTKGDIVWPANKKPGGGKSCSIKTGTSTEGRTDKKTSVILPDSMMYVLECLDKDGKEVKAQYATVAAPYLLEIRNSLPKGTFEYIFSLCGDSESMFCRLEMAKVNKENDGKKVTEGFQEEWKTTGNLWDMDYAGEYPVSGKLMVDALNGSYTNSVPEFKEGDTYFGRIKTEVYVQNLKLVSSPSNVISLKGGPEACVVLGMAGVRFDMKEASAKTDQNKFNLERATRAYKHLSESYIYSEEEDLNVGIEEEDDGLKATDADEEWRTYIHEDHGTDQKSGMVFFLGVEDEKDVKSYELLRSETYLGNYKKIKSYNLNDKMLLKVDEENHIYGMQYTSFPTEKTYYYAVRAVSKVKNAPGGYGYGEENTTQVGKVQGLTTSPVTNNAKAIQLAWIGDDSAKQYYIYRKDPGTEVWNLIQKQGAGAGKKVTYEKGGEKFEYRIASFVDKDSKKKPVETGATYQYYVRPVYDVKNEKNYESKVSPEVQGVAQVTYSQVKNLKITNYSIGQTNISFKDMKGVNQYVVYRLEVGKSDKKIPLYNDASIIVGEKDGTIVYRDAIGNKLDGDPEKWTDAQWYDYFRNKGWTEVGSKITSEEDTATVSIPDTKVKVGGYYFYLVQPMFRPDDQSKESSTSVLLTFSSRIRNVPLAPTGLKADRRDSKNGANLSWGMNKNDKTEENLQRMFPAVKWSGDGSKGWTYLNQRTYRYSDTTGMGSGTRKYEVAWFYVVSTNEPPAGGNYDTWTKKGNTIYYLIQGASAYVDYKKPGDINVNPGSITLDGVNAVQSVSASNGTDDKVEVSNSNSAVVTVERRGNTKFNVIAKQSGTATLTFSCGGKSRSISVTVK